MARFLTKIASGVEQLVSAIASTAGVADAGKILETDANGLIDPSFFPPGIADNVFTAIAGEALTAGDFVYVDAAGEVFKADNGSITTEAIGFVTAGFGLGATATVFTSGINDQVTTTAGTRYFLGSAGAATATPPAFSVGDICQNLGVAREDNTIVFEYNPAIEYATQ